VPLQELDLGSLRRQCGVVTQDTQMLSGSVLEAITMMRPNASMTDVTDAARIAAVHDEIVAMPMGYETVLGEGGAGLSGGQLQRLALARAVLARPAVLLLDEATSHLDAATEEQVQRAVNRLRCTRIVIAHRLSTVRNADRILVVHGGRVVETGAHEELVATGGHYAALVAPQLH
jgi:ABC-type bacteriocin/lantibiotic exporter with double-glycine peptidase domain